MQGGLGITVLSCWGDEMSPFLLSRVPGAVNDSYTCAGRGSDGFMAAGGESEPFQLFDEYLLIVKCLLVWKSLVVPSFVLRVER